METNDLRLIPNSYYFPKAKYEYNYRELTNNGLRNRIVFVFRTTDKKAKKIEFYGTQLTDYCFRFRRDKEYSIGLFEGALSSISDGQVVYFRQGNKIVYKDITTRVCTVANAAILSQAIKNGVETRKALKGVDDPEKRKRISDRMFIKHNLSFSGHRAAC